MAWNDWGCNCKRNPWINYNKKFSRQCLSYLIIDKILIIKLYEENKMRTDNIWQ
jgi:hypothetical protein